MSPLPVPPEPAPAADADADAERDRGPDPELVRRVVIEGVRPQVECGRFPIKRTAGEWVTVEADVFADGHDALACRLLHRREDDEPWRETVMDPLGNDRWRASFRVEVLGRYLYTVEGWIDRFGSWRRDLAKRVEAGQDVAVDLRIGAALLREAAERAGGADRKVLRGLADGLDGSGAGGTAGALSLALDPETAALAGEYPDRSSGTRYRRELPVVVDRERARFSAWYEVFPRSAAPPPAPGEAQRHGTFADVEERILPYVAEMGFDVLYLPPIHPVGTTHRKGKNNARTAAPGDVGSPWAIGSEEGGHKAIHPDLGTAEDFRRLVRSARERGVEIALDVAFQCSPDHPYVREHPEWFRKRPDGTIQYAENPPKKYEDIVPFDFEGATPEGSPHTGWQALWLELESVFEHWIGEGVSIFRVDNPHTKSLRFWEWAIRRIRRRHPEVIFLSEAFTRPRIMYRLAKLGFTQSYTYFAWRNTKHDLTAYFTELTRTEAAEFFRPNLWPNTPDILTEVLQIGGRAAFVQRLVLAATLGASYGIYGPAFELMESTPRERGSEEYLDSEKYQLRAWDLDGRGERRDSLRDLIARINRIRRDNPALHSDRSLVFHGVDNDQLLCYSKTAPAGDGSAGPDPRNAILVVVNLDPHHRQSGWTHLDPDALGVEDGRPFQVHDLLTDARYLWHGRRNYVELDPVAVPAHVFRVRRRVRTEQDFDYFS